VLVTEDEVPLQALGEKILREIPGIKGVVQNINPKSRNTVLGRKWKTIAGASHIEIDFCGKRFTISPGAFFQVNTHQAEKLFKEALRLAELKKTDVVWDAFCGVGVLALIAADHVHKVIGTECVPEAIADAKVNGLQTPNASFYVAKAEERIFEADVTFLNPPRKGCERALLEKIASKRIIYISCDPATLARDLAVLAGRGYHIDVVQPFDMFPQTMHVETLVSMRF
jgi:23S rRNA (uracil1939-C5)-methyltransferase